MYSNYKKSNIKNNHFQEKFQESSANISQSGFMNERTNGKQQQGEGKTIQLLTVQSGGKIQLNEEALDIIASYNDKPVGFVSLVGKYRTGKSFLLNKLLFLQGKGFRVQSYTKACTQGIWMWSSPILNQYLDNYLFFLDTQGLSSLQKNDANDTKILTLASLISSYLIYNSVGSIDQRSIGQLNAVTKLSRNILTDDRLSSQENEQKLYEFMPKFLWLLRDFLLELQDERRRKITPKQYLQNCLKQDNTQIRINQDTRRIKRSLLTYFKDRDCLTLVRPARQQQEIQSLNRLPDISLRRQFIEGVNALRQKIQKNAGCKKYQGKQLHGDEIVCMIESYAKAINQGAIPNIKTAWEHIAEDQGALAYNMALQKYTGLYQHYFEQGQPKQEKQIYRILSDMKQASILQFKRNSTQDNQQYYKKLKDFIKQKQEQIVQVNQNVSEAKNVEILKDESHELMRKTQSNYYQGKKDQYARDLDLVVSSYKRKAVGEKKQALLAQFLTTMNKISMNLDKPVVNQYQNPEYMARQAQQMLRIEEQKARAKNNANKASKGLKDIEDKNNDKIKSNKDKLKDKDKKESGCCGGKCQIM